MHNTCKYKPLYDKKMNCELEGVKVNHLSKNQAHVDIVNLGIT